MMKKLTQRGLPFRNQWKMGVLVVGFLAIFFFGGGKVNATFTEVFSDDFNRNELGDNWAVVKSGYAIDGDYSNDNISLRQYRITNNKLVATGEGYGGFSYPIIYVGQNLRNGKIVFDVHTNEYSTNQLYSAVARLNSNGDYYGAYFSPLTNNINIVKVTADGTQTIFSNQTELCGVFYSITTGTDYHFEFIVSSISDTTSELIANLYASGNDTTPLKSIKCNDSTANLQTAGKWGEQDYMRQPIDNVVIFAENSLKLIPNLTTLGLNQTGILQIFDANFTEQTVFLSDNVRGTFVPNSVELTSTNGYVAEVEYRPAGLGEVTITASSISTVNTILTVYPYNPTIGFIGDSVTVGFGGPNVGAEDHVVQQFITQMGGAPYKALNKGSGGSKASQWAGREIPCDGEQAPDCMTKALEDFGNNGVEIVMIMLGVNDTEIDLATYKADISSIINKLKAVGIKKIILNQPTYATYKGNIFSRYIDVLKELVDGETVFLGDNEGYNMIKNDYLINGTGNMLYDSVHLLSTGQIALATLWVNAYNRILVEPLTLIHNWTGENSDTYVLGSATGLGYSVDKDFVWFDVTGNNFANVLVDDVIVNTDDYTVKNDSTIITLLPTYLNTLQTGDYILIIRFTDGISVKNTFTITSPSCNNGATNYPTCNDNQTPSNPTSPSSSGGGGGGGSSLSKDTCPNGDFSSSYYDKTCGTTADLKAEVAKKVNILRPLIVRIYLTATQEQKTLVYDLISSCSVKNKREVIKLACQELISNRDF